MKKLKKIFIIITLLVLMLILLVNLKVFASSTSNSEQEVEYSEEYINWLELSDEEKQNVIKPRMYNVVNTEIIPKNPLLRASLLRTTLSSKYTLQDKDIILNNLIIKNQQDTGSCWAFSALSSLETNLALANLKNGTNTSKVYDFSERHMEYATSKTFANNETNSQGYTRSVGEGGNWQIASSYLTNGIGAIDESAMPFENNENIIDISNIQNKKVTSQVYDTIEFEEYSKYTDEEKKNEINNQIKNHIQNYGAVFASIHAGGSAFSFSTAFDCYDNETGAKFCSSSFGHKADHAVSIIGWDDNYSIDNFVGDTKPISNGAWIVRNSWGEETGDNGIIYVSYEDYNISKGIYGIIKSANNVDYENIYYYDDYAYYEMIRYGGKGVDINGNDGSFAMLSNIFDKKTQQTEFLTQVSFYTPETSTCRVYVNPNGTSKSKSDLQLVELKEGETETFNAGYHTLEFLNPIEIKAQSFTVVIEIKSAKTLYPRVALETSNSDASAKMESGKCFIAAGNDLENCEWIDLSELTKSDSSKLDGDSTIKAFTVSKIIDHSLKDIEITTEPTRTSYFEGENFDSNGMVITANYNDDTSQILESSDYSITNGANLKAGQTSVTITYEDKSVEQPIEVIKNKVENIAIATPPTKTEYWAGDDFDKTGMVIEATYTDGTTVKVTDYTILDGSSLKNGQATVTVSYEEKTVTQEINVKENFVVKIEITKNPNKTNYVVGQNFDCTGMIVKATYENGTLKEITDYTVRDGNDLYEGQATVTIVYEDKTITQAITVVSKMITEINVKTAPTKIKYIQNKEELDLTGGVIEITYNDSTKENIEMTSDEISVTGFSNSELGKITITLAYQSKTTQCEVEIIEETVIEENAENSKMDNMVCDVKKVKAYYFTDNSQNDYILIEVETSGIEKNLNNDKMEYYYYLSSNKNEEEIKDWVEITETQDNNGNLKFTIDSSKVANYSEIANANVLYLYVKEVAIKGGSQSVQISNAIVLDTDADIEIYVDNVKQDNQQTNDSNANNSGDNTISTEKLPNTGTRLTIVIIIVALSIIGILLYIKYKKLSIYVK